MTNEEAIRWLEDIHRRFNPTGENLENEGGDVHLQALDMAIEALSMDRPQEWIPVSERLPIPPTFCLVTTDGNHGDVIDIALYMSDGWHKASEVLAWMPLPKPYKGGDNT